MNCTTKQDFLSSITDILAQCPPDAAYNRCGNDEYERPTETQFQFRLQHRNWS